MLRPVFWFLRVFGAVLVVASLWVAWLLVDSDEATAAVLAATAGISFFVTRSAQSVDILGRTVVESVLIPPNADRYALVPMS